MVVGSNGGAQRALSVEGRGGGDMMIKKYNQLMIIKVSGASGHGGQWRGGKRRQVEREKAKGGGGSTTITCH
jgi:hypothetical protein